MIVTMMLMIVTTIPAIPTVSSIVKYTMYLSLYFPSVNTGSSQNVLILAKGEPLPVLVTPCHYYNIFVVFCKWFLLIITN